MLDEIGVVVDLLSHPGFLTGLATGLIAAAVLFGVAVATERHPSGWGLAFAAAVVAGLWFQLDIDRLDLVGEPHPPWVWIVFPLVVVGAGAGIWLLGQSDVSPVVGPMVAISVAGAWVTVPETDIVTVLVGAAIPLGLATLPPIRARSWLLGGLAFSAAFAWLVVAGGEVRPWTIVASWATLATLPVFAALIRSIPLRINPYWMTGIHLAYVVVITRVADATDSTAAVAVAAVILTALSAMAFGLLSRTPQLTDSRT